MPNFIYSRASWVILLLVGIFGSITLLSTPAYAAGESYSYVSGSAKNKITGTNGWYRTGVSGNFEKTTGIKPDSGYDTVVINAQMNDPFANNNLCFIALSVNTSTNKFKLMNNSRCSSANSSVLEGAHGMTGSVTETSSGSTITDPEKVATAAKATAKAFGKALDDVKQAWYASGKAPCSSQGCDESAWEKRVYECWQGARTDAAEAARYSQNSNFSLDRSTKDFFSSCLATKVSNTTSVNGINKSLVEIKAADINKAADEAKVTLDEDRDAENSGDAAEETSTCRIDGLGWIICPVMTITAALVDGAYLFVESLLKVQPIMTTGDTEGIYDAWQMMRSFANVCFVIAFLIIIFSQLTSVGISNYGIKKLLPRIIVAAILVNVSYWICAIAVDISNILGSSLRGLFASLGAEVSAPEGGVFSGSTPWANATGFILAGLAGVGVVMYTTLAALLPALVAALVAIVTVFLVLTLRQALIILLIVIAPLAFVALLLPNTESWFKKWRGLLQTLLLMYPIIAVIFGASAFASQIVMKTGNTMAIQIMGALISILPLAITPVVMKTAGGLLNRFGGIVNNPNKGPIDKLRRGAEGVKESRQARARGLRLTGQGANKFSRGWRRTAAVPSRVRNRLAAGADRNKALNEAADAGYMMNSSVAQEASQIRMAASAANSARQSQSLQGLNTQDQLNVLGQANADENRSLNAAIRGQIQQGEKQAVGEIEAQLAPSSAAQLGKALEDAIKNGDTLSAQAAQNRLSTMGNKGADVMRNAIINREKAAANDPVNEKNENWTEMRVELARNLNGTMMQKDEALKNWATQTEMSMVNGVPTLAKTIDTKNGPVLATGSDAGTTDISLDEHTKRLTDATNEKFSALSTDKFKNQTPKMQRKLLEDESNPVSDAVMQASLNPNNIGSFDPEIVKLMQQKLNPVVEPEVTVQPLTVDPQPIPQTGMSIPHGAAPSNSRTATPDTKGFSTATFSDSEAKIILPDSAIRDINKATTPAPSEAPTVVNNTVNSTTNVTNSGGWVPVNNPAASNPAGRRSSGAVPDGPSSSSRSSDSFNRAAAPTPPDDPASIPTNLDDFR